MRNESLEPNESDLERTGGTILELQPLVVVLTGGDPLFSPHLETAIERIHGKAGIIVDTSGYTFRSGHIELFKKHKIALRISIDSERPQVHEWQRPTYAGYPAFRKRGKTLETALGALCQCLDTGIPVTVQTVATKKTANDLVGLGDKLFRLGVRSWRIFKVAPSQARMEQYKRLVGMKTDSGKTYPSSGTRDPYEHAFEQVLKARRNSWGDAMAVQVTYNERPNAVILVSPDGRFLTESNVGAGKVPIDQKRPKRPSLSALRTAVDMDAHRDRYLNMTTPI